MDEAALRQELVRLRAEIDAVDDWSNGVFMLLIEVLPQLLRDHPNASKVRDSLKRSAERYDLLLAHPEHAEDGGPAGLYEARKMAYRLLALTGVFPGVDPGQVAKETIAGFRRRDRE